MNSLVIGRLMITFEALEVQSNHSMSVIMEDKTKIRMASMEDLRDVK